MALTANDGYQALEIVNAQPVDLILLDIMMPGMNGMEVLERLKTDSVLRTLPVIVITAVDDWDRVGACIERGAEDYIVKPFNAILLKSRMTNCIEKKRLHDLEQAHREALAKSNAQLENLNATLERSRDDLASILNQLEIGTIMTDTEGRLSFLSQVASKILNQSSGECLGLSWEDVLSLPKSEASALLAMIQRPAKERTKVSVHIDSPLGTRFWLEVDVKDDPRTPQRKIFFLYDTTEVHDLRRLLTRKTRFHDLVGNAKAMQDIYQRIEDIARVDAPVLIEGETGTGKELVARAIHESSSRQHKPFLAVNCAGLTDSLLGSQLFGHTRGAFTGATSDHRGFFEAAEGGTLFLDEIGDMPLSIQTTLLRALQEKEIIRLGESQTRKIDVRILAATHHNLAEQVTAGNFRADLLYRIRVARLTLPALRERREDIPLLSANFLRESQAMTGKTHVQEISTEAMQHLLRYPWPGNVRELKSAIDYALIHCKDSIIQPVDLPPEILDSPAWASSAPDSAEHEKEHLLAVLQQVKGNRSEAARLLGMSRSTFYRRLSALNIPSEEQV